MARSAEGRDDLFGDTRQNKRRHWDDRLIDDDNDTDRETEAGRSSLDAPS